MGLLDWLFGDREFLFPERYRPTFSATSSTIVALQRTSIPGSRLVEEFMPDGYRGTVRSGPPETRGVTGITSVVFTTPARGDAPPLVRCVYFAEGAAFDSWAVAVDDSCVSERLFARRGNILVVPARGGGIQALSLVDGRTVWVEQCSATLATAPRVLDSGALRCGLSDGTVVDVDLETATTIARMDAAVHRGALRGGRPLGVVDYAESRSAWIDGAEYRVLDERLHGRGKWAAAPPGYDVSAPLIEHVGSLIAWMTRPRGTESDVAVGFFAATTLALEGTVEISGSRDGRCLSAYVVDDVLCARVLADDIATVLVDLRTRAPAGKLHDRTSRFERAPGVQRGDDLFGSPLRAPRCLPTPNAHLLAICVRCVAGRVHGAGVASDIADARPAPLRCRSNAYSE